MTGLVAQVVLPLPVSRVFSYAVPPDLGVRLAPGHRVRVPLRRHLRHGVVIAVTPGPTDGLVSVETALDAIPALPEPLVELARRAAEQTLATWGEAIGRALPPGKTASAGPSTEPVRPAPAPPGPIVVGRGRDRHRLVEAALDKALGAGQGALLLAPEIEQARNWAARLRGRGIEPVALLTGKEPTRLRWAAWWACRAGTARVAVGTRAAAFAPIAPLGVAIVVDEHDPAHRALGAPRWHSRELALERTRLDGGECLLVSATPSLESWVRAESGQARLEVADGGAWPAVHRVDLRREDDEASLSAGLREAVQATIAAGESALLILNRLGYGDTLGCAECGAVRRCPRCRIPLRYHLRERLLDCRLCGWRHAAASLCPRCRGRRLLPSGWGTERLEAELRASFPGVRVGRYDGAIAPSEARHVRAAFRAGEIRLLVGTSMALRLLADRVVSLAAMVHVDATLNRPDFRAAEQTLQLAWRLAEGTAAGGSVWLQSHHPDHPVLDAVARGSTEAFYRAEWAERQELGYPPARRLARLVVEGPEALREARALAETGRSLGLVDLGPAPLAGGRFQLVLLGGEDLPRVLAGTVEALRARRGPRATRVAVEIDPLESV